MYYKIIGTPERHAVENRALIIRMSMPSIASSIINKDKVRLLVDFYRHCLKFRTILLSDRQVHLDFLNYCNVV